LYIQIAIVNNERIILFSGKEWEIESLGAVTFVFLISDKVYFIAKQKKSKRQNYHLFIYLI
jgi:hypothetical protein